MYINAKTLTLPVLYEVMESNGAPINTLINMPYYNPPHVELSCLLKNSR